MTRTDRLNFVKGMTFISPWLIGFTAFTVIPIYLSFKYSLSDFSLLQPPAYTGLSNYRELSQDPIFWQSLVNTLYYAAFALPCGMVISLALALLLNTNIVGQGIYRTIIFLPSLVPTVAAAMLWKWLFNTQLGLINLVLGWIHINPVGWFDEPKYAMPALILMSFWGVGNTVVIYLAGLQDVPRELYEAADLDGVNAWQRLWNVTIPMISPVIFFNLVMALIGTFQVFSLPYIMTQGGPQRSTYFFTMYLYDNAFTYLKMGYASAMAWIQLLIILTLTAVAAWTSRRWVHYQGK